MKRTKVKFKTNKSARNRFKITKGGKVLRLSSFARHLKRTKSKKQLRRLKRAQPVAKAEAKKVKKLLGKG